MAIERGFLDKLSLSHVNEVRYLATDLTRAYRAVVAFLYERYEASETGWVTPAETVAFMREQHPDRPDYTERECLQHLSQLETWGVVTSELNVENVRTLQEFLSHARRYQITERGRLTEEFARQLETDDATRGSLEVGRILRLWDALVQIDKLLAANDGRWGASALAEFEGAWAAADDARTEIRAQALRYMSELDDERLDDLGDIESFTVYKALIRSYVGSFHLALQNFRDRSHGLFEEWRGTGRTARLVAGLVAVARDRKGDRRDVAALTAIYEGQIAALVGFSAPNGTARILEDKTLGRLLALITRIERLVLERRAVVDRRRDLENLALAFRRAPDNVFAHELAAVAFSFGSPQHMSRYSLADSELRANESVWLQEPWDVELRRATRGNRLFQAVSIIRDRSTERARLRQERAAERAGEKAFWDGLFAGGSVSLEDLSLPNAAALNCVWNAVRSCMRDPARRTRLLDGSTIVLHLPGKVEATGIVRCPGGVLHTRPFVLDREGADA